MKNLNVGIIGCDEQWDFIAKKQRRVRQGAMRVDTPRTGAYPRIIENETDKVRKENCNSLMPTIPDPDQQHIEAAAAEQSQD